MQGENLRKSDIDQILIRTIKIETELSEEFLRVQIFNGKN